VPDDSLTLGKTGTYTQSMKPTRRPLPIFVIFALAIALPAVVGTQAVEHAVYVSALDKAGAPVEILAPTDVIVREDDVRREVLRVAPADEPMQIALLVDNSQAAESIIRFYRDALPSFISGLLTDTDFGENRNQVALIAVAERPTILADYTADEEVLRKGVDRLFAMTGSGAYLLDGIIETSRGITKRGSPRPVIVAITTEGPEMSDRHFNDVLPPLRAAGAALHVITIGPWSNQSSDRTYVIEVGPRETGGSRTNLALGSALNSRLKLLAAELTHQFRVTYARPQSLIQPDRVTVTSGRPDLTVRGTAVNNAREQARP
jgi:hypothetical protein